MLVINEDLLAIDEAVNRLVKDLVDTDHFQDYLEKKQTFEQDKILQKDILAFKELVIEYEKAKESFASRVDVKNRKRGLIESKRALDLHPNVRALRLAEVAFQEILAQISEAIAETVSSSIQDCL